MIWFVLFIIYIVVAAFVSLVNWSMLNLDDATGAFGWPVLTAAWLIRMAWLITVAVVAGILYFILDLLERTLAIFGKKI